MVIYLIEVVRAIIVFAVVLEAVATIIIVDVAFDVVVPLVLAVNGVVDASFTSIETSLTSKYCCCCFVSIMILCVLTAVVVVRWCVF